MDELYSVYFVRCACVMVFISLHNTDFTALRSIEFLFSFLFEANSKVCFVLFCAQFIRSCSYLPFSFHISFHSGKNETLQKFVHAKEIAFMCSKRNRMGPALTKRFKFTYQLTFSMCVCTLYTALSCYISHRVQSKFRTLYSACKQASKPKKNRSIHFKASTPFR